jgi:hypothetical protein
MKQPDLGSLPYRIQNPDPSPNHGAIATRNQRRENMSLVSYYLYYVYYKT